MTSRAGAPQVLRAEAGPPLRLELAVEPGLVWLRGHFPGCPILPGVVQLDWAIRLASEYLGTSRDVTGIFALKFSRVVQPGVPVTLVLERTREGLTFQYERDRVHCSSGRVACAR